MAAWGHVFQQAVQAARQIHRNPIGNSSRAIAGRQQQESSNISRRWPQDT
jgi:hypothetical protein